MKRGKEEITIQDVVAATGCATAFYLLINKLLLHAVLTTGPAYLRRIIPAGEIVPAVDDLGLLLVVYGIVFALPLSIIFSLGSEDCKIRMALFFKRLCYGRFCVAKIVVSVFLFIASVIIFEYFGINFVYLSLFIGVFVVFIISTYFNADYFSRVVLSVCAFMVIILFFVWGSIARDMNHNDGSSEKIKIISSTDFLDGADVVGIERVGDSIFLTTKNATYVIPWNNVGAIKRESE